MGKIQQVNDPSGTYAFAYDKMGRLIGTTTTYSFLNTPFTNSYSYDADSNCTGFTAPDSSTNTYTYDTLNRLSTLANSWPGSFGFSYDAISRRTQMTRPNGIATNYAYDKLSHLLSVLHQVGSSTIDGEAYTVDPAGNRTAKTDYLASATSNYAYDKIYELTQVTGGNPENYSYDPVGNRLSSLGVSSYSNNTSNELTSTSNASYTYDANGNTTSKTDSTGTTNYTWDFENRMTQVTLPGTGGTESYRYDPFGRRIQKVFTQGSNTTTTNFVYDGNSIIDQTDQNGSVLARYAQGQNIDEPLAESTAGSTNFYEQDGLDSVTSLTSGTGALAQTYTYDSFGKLTNSSGSLTNTRSGSPAANSIPRPDFTISGHATLTPPLADSSARTRFASGEELIFMSTRSIRQQISTIRLGWSRKAARIATASQLMESRLEKSAAATRIPYRTTPQIPIPPTTFTWAYRPDSCSRTAGTASGAT